MGDDAAQRLRLLAAELRAEVERIDRTVSELTAAGEALGQEEPPRFALYAAAALLDTFYTGIEKALLRVATVDGVRPSGPAWHRTLLDNMSLDVAGVRPPVLSRDAVRSLDPYLSFRHRFRNLYLFDIEATLMLPLAERARAVWRVASPELLAFARHVETIAGDLVRS